MGIRSRFQKPSLNIISHPWLRSKLVEAGWIVAYHGCGKPPLNLPLGKGEKMGFRSVWQEKVVVSEETPP